MIKPIVFRALMLIGVCVAQSFAQTGVARSRNNPYSPSPASGNTQSGEIAANIVKPSATTLATTNLRSGENPAVSLTSIYKVGIGDVLYINVKNSVNASGYYTVRRDGTIDFSLAGGNVEVASRTTDEISSQLAKKVTLYREPQIQVSVREYGSHKVTVSGLVERPGVRSIQREAVPIYVICADALVDQKAASVVIKRGDQKGIFALNDKSSEAILIYPGDEIEFVAETKASTPGYYSISGEIANSGRQELSTGMTLIQAINAAGGAKGSAKRAVIRRKIESGKLTITEYDLKPLRAGKTSDPTLLPGDTIELIK